MTIRAKAHCTGKSIRFGETRSLLKTSEAPNAFVAITIGFNWITRAGGIT
jgi:hypothetical protein